MIAAIGDFDGSCDSRGNAVAGAAIREAAAAGDMARVWETQGYPFFIAGRVIRGNGRGRILGYPTANIAINQGKASIRNGVYATLVHAMERWYIGAANVGSNPTFDDVRDTRFEVNLLDFDGDLYGREITVFIIEHIRDEIRFDNADSLKEQMLIDTRAIREIVTRSMEAHRDLWEALGKAIV